MVEYRKDLLRKREELLHIKTELQNQADRETDEFKGFTKQMLSKYADVFEDVFTNIGTIVTGQSALKLQIEALKNAIFAIPEVKKSPELQREIESILRKYDQNI